jgi:NADH:ubiquinone oxidoreductase subunit K
LDNFRTRRLAVIDLHGYTGSRVRLWLVRVEVLLATAVGAIVGTVFIRQGTALGWVLGLLALGIAANYLVLTLWVLVLWNRERLATEFNAYDIAGDGRYYTVGQFRLLMPFYFVLLAARSTERRV